MTTPFQGCIAEALAKGEMDAKTAEFAREVHADALENADKALGPVDADRAAGAAVITALQREAERVERLRRMTVRNRLRNLAGAAEFMKARGYSDVLDVGGAGRGGKPPKDGWVIGGKPPTDGPYRRGGVLADYLKEVVDGTGGIDGAGVPSVKGRYQAIRGSLDAMMAEVIDTFESGTGLAIRGRATLETMVREAFGEDTGDAAAKALAKAWAETADHARKIYNAAGGDIGHMEGWGLPQVHDPIAIKRAGRDGWVEAVLPRLDRARMIDNVTARPFSDKRLRAVLGETWDRIVSMGGVDREVGESLGVGMVANRRADPRFLRFKSADDWLAYSGAFGRGDPYAAMMTHLDGLARDAARMQVLGPNADHEFEWLAKTAQRQTQIEQARAGAADEGAMHHTDGRIKTARAMYREFVGEVSGPFGSENVVADVFAGARAALAGIQLGSAIINDISNPVFAAQVRTNMGLSKLGDFKAFASYVVSNETRQTARRTGLIFEGTRARYASAMTRLLRSQTVGGKIYNGANAVSRLLPQWINQAAFLNVETKAARWAFQQEFMGRGLADRAHLSLPQLLAHDSDEFRRFGALIEARGFTAAEWDKVRATPAVDGFITPRGVAAHAGDDLGWRVAEMIERETRDAVPEPSLWARSQLKFGTDPGTVQGELVRSMATYRSFTVTQTYRWARSFAFRAHQKGVAGEGRLPWQMIAATHAAPLLIGTTIAGFAINWLKDIVKGNDPRPLWDDDDPKEARKRALRVTGDAILAGGGMGIFGDFFHSVEARNGKSSALTGLGSPAAFVSDAYDYTIGNANDALSGKDAHFGRDTARMAGRYNPFSSLWWSRLAFQRTVTDQMQKLIDPEADEDFQRRISRQEKDFGMTPWWRPGEVLPDRAPSAAAIVGAEEGQ